MNIYETYRETEILTADPIRLTEILYREAVEATRLARACLHAGEIESRGRAISRVSGIVIELASSLDQARGGELSRTLAELYVYILGRLTDAHASQIEQPLAEVEQLLLTLLDGWSSLNSAGPEVPPELYANLEAEREQVCCTF
jgi:flagellar protein FliS